MLCVLIKYSLSNHKYVALIDINLLLNRLLFFIMKNKNEREKNVENKRTEYVVFINFQTKCE